jgi:hypothetical protein
MSFIIMQQVQPHFIIAHMQSQQAWIMSQQALSPLMQVTQTPSPVISYMHMPIVRLQEQTIAPFIMQQRLHFELAIMEQRFCSMLQLILSSQLQVIFMPAVHFSIFMMQRGIIMPVMAGFIVGMLAPIPDIIPVIPVIGFIVAVVMVKLLGFVSTVLGHLGHPTDAEMMFALSER